MSAADKLTTQRAIEVQHEIINHAWSILEAKRKDYAGSEDPFGNFRMSEFVGIPPWQGCMVRMMDKLSRIRHIVESGQVHVKEESLLDTFADVINYTCILAGLCEEEKMKWTTIAANVEEKSISKTSHAWLTESEMS